MVLFKYIKIIASGYMKGSMKKSIAKPVLYLDLLLVFS